ncbi:hypothetical protein D3C81_2020010 [compost metagenome]
MAAVDDKRAIQFAAVEMAGKRGIGDHGTRDETVLRELLAQRGQDFRNDRVADRRREADGNPPAIRAALAHARFARAHQLVPLGQDLACGLLQA